MITSTHTQLYQIPKKLSPHTVARMNTHRGVKIEHDV